MSLENLGTPSKNRWPWSAESDRGQELDRLPIAVLLVDQKTGQLVFVNETARKYVESQSADEVLKASYFDPLLCTTRSGKLLNSDEMPLSRAARGETLEGFEMVWNLPTGKKTLLFHSSEFLSSSPHSNNSQIPQSSKTIIITWEDITTWCLTQLQLEEAVKLRDDFLSIASHELRTPLAGLKLNLSLVLRMLNKPAIDGHYLKQRIDITAQMADRLTRLIDELLDVSRIASGRLKLQTKLTNLSRLTKQILTGIVENITGSDNKFSESIEEEVVGYWDEVRMGQIITNLLTNASKYGAGKPIHIRIWKNSKCAYISVQDRGIGIAPKDQKRIFNRFERVATGSDSGGLGVGLWIVQQVVEAHGGKLFLESEIGKGSTFTVEIPVRGKLESHRGKPLDTLIPVNGMAITDFLPIAVQIAQRVNEVHRDGTILQTLRPENLIIDVETNEVWFAEEWEGNNKGLHSSRDHSITRILQFISPEHTGRTNRSIDYRSDLYNLGLIFYTMLAGSPPFVTEDLVELMRWQAAKVPAPLAKLRNDIPNILESIVTILLEKKPEDRYLSSAGVRDDLDRCKQEYESLRKITPFKLREKDIPVTFAMSGRIYGREKEVAIILRSFESVAHGNPKFMLVSGYSGIGKSSVVNEVHKPITDRRGYFVSGKFDQFKRDVPYDVLLQALKELVRQVLQESASQVALWKKEILQAVHPNAQVLIDVIPQLETLLGPQPKVTELGPAESKNRFNRVVHSFISVFAKPEHPLVIFLDDLQWSDRSTLNLIELVLQASTDEALLLIGAYRDNEVGPHHPLSRMIDHLQSIGTSLENILLSPLNQFHVTQITADTCRTDTVTASGLGALIYSKTAGNPFFVNQVLKNLYQQNLLRLDPASQSWHWSMSEIEKLGISDDVVEMLTRRMKQFEKPTQSALRLAACIGNQFNLKTLSVISELPMKDLIQNLKKGIDDGFLIPITKEYKTPEDMGELVREGLSSRDEFESLNLKYKFLHDRVQQAAYGLIEGEERKAVHLKIGRLLLKFNQGPKLEEAIFSIVTHFNHSLDLIEDPDEQNQVLHLNLMAGRKARSAASFEPALNYLTMAVSCLPENSWKNNYDLTFSCYLEKAEAEYLNGNWDQATAIYDLCSRNVKNTLDKCRISIDKCIAYRAKNDLRSALNATLEGLLELGYSFDPFPDWGLVVEEQKKTLKIIHNTGIKNLTNLPFNDDKVKNSVSELFQELLSPTYLLGSNLLPIAAMKLIQLACQEGNTTGSVFGYLFYGFILASQFDEIDLGLEIGQVGLDLHSKLGTKKVEAEIFDTWGGLTLHYKQPLQECHPWLRKAFTSGLETGSFTWAGYSTINLLYQVFFGVKDIPYVKKLTEEFIPVLRNIDPNMRKFHLMVREAIENLTETPERKTVLMGKWFNEKETLDFAKSTQDIFTQFTYYTIKTALALWFGMYNQAVEFGDECKQYLTPGVYLNPVFHFLHGFALIGSYMDASADMKVVRKKQIDFYSDRISLWARNCPSTYTHMECVIQAGLSWLKGDEDQATLLLDKGIESALENGFVQNAALAAELGGRFILRRGHNRILGRVYIDESKKYFESWGAVGKVRVMKMEYRTLLDRKFLRTAS